MRLFGSGNRGGGNRRHRRGVCLPRASLRIRTIVGTRGIALGVFEQTGIISAVCRPVNMTGDVCALACDLGFRGIFVDLVRERVHRRNLERLIAQHERFHQRTATAHERPVHPAVFLLAGCQVVLFGVNAA